MVALTIHLFIWSSPHQPFPDATTNTVKILENISLSSFTTFKTGGNARFFVAVKTVEELQEAVAFAHENNLSIFALGGGSNILVQDAGFSGLVIKIEITGKETKQKSGEKKENLVAEVESNSDVEVIAGAGEPWDEFVAYTVAQGFTGLENLSYIPGKVGAAPVQNIGAYGVEVESKINFVEVFNTETKEIKKFTKEQCEFSYRKSIFKKAEYKKYIITRVSFILKRFNIEDKNEKNKNTDLLSISYKDIQEYIKVNNIAVEELNPEIIRNAVIAIRKKKLPDVWQKDALGTAGSFFKNPIILKTYYYELLKMYPELPYFKTDKEDYVKVPAAWLLDKVCGFKGYREGNVGVYQNQALVLVNFGGAYSQEIISLAEKMIGCVKEKTNILLEKEVEVI